MGGVCSKGEEDYNIKCVICKKNSPQLGRALCNKCVQDVEQRQDEAPKKKIKSKKKKKSNIKKRRRTKKNKIEHYKRRYKDSDKYLLWWVN